MNAKLLLPVCVALLGASGCASIEPRPGFEQVSQTIDQRLHKQIHWDRGGADAEPVRKHVAELLRAELTADTAVQVALLSSPRLQATYEDLGIAQADLVQAGLLRNPVLDAMFRDTRDGQHRDLDIGLKWDVLGIFTMARRKQAAAQDFEAAKLDVTARVLDLAGEVRTTFYSAQADRQLVEMMRQVVEATGAAADAARRLREAGNITALALDQEQATAEEARLLLAAAEASLNASRERLNVVMGLWGSEAGWKMAPRLAEITQASVDEAGVEKQAVANSLDLAMLRQRLESAAKQAGVTDVTSVIPDLELGWFWARDAGEWKDGPGFAVALPVFDLGQAERAKARSTVQRLQARYVQKAVEVRSAARQAVLDLRAARSREHYLRQILLPLRSRITQGMQHEYNAMQVGVFRLLQIQQQQILTGRRYVEALRDYWLARARIGQLLNGRMGSGKSMAASGTPTALDMTSGGGH